MHPHIHNQEQLIPQKQESHNRRKESFRNVLLSY